MATPATAATVVVPVRVAAGSPLPDLIARVMLVASPVALPNWSRIATLIVPSVAPAFALAGCWVKARWSAAAGLTVRALLSALVRAPSVACSW